MFEEVHKKVADAQLYATFKFSVGWKPEHRVSAKLVDTYLKQVWPLGSKKNAKRYPDMDSALKAMGDFLDGYTPQR